MKKICRILAKVTCLSSIVLAGCENLDGSCDVWWTLGWALCALASAIVVDMLSEEEERNEQHISVEEVRKSFPNLKYTHDGDRRQS